MNCIHLKTIAQLTGFLTVNLILADFFTIGW